MTNKRWWAIPTRLLLGAAMMAGSVVAHATAGPLGFEITTLSNRADLVSGGDVLVEVQFPKHVDADKVAISLNRQDVTGAFKPSGPNKLQGLVTGLVDGKNLLEAGVKVHHHFLWWSWDEVINFEKLKVTNHPIGGPIFSGPQIQPWVCATPTPQPGTDTVPHTNPSGLGTLATDAQCNIATEYHYYYKPTNASPACLGAVGPGACFIPYDANSPPNDVSMTTTENGQTVPFILRVERGTIDRGIYDIAVLWDPSKPASEQTAWVGKFQYAFGVASGSPRRQFQPNSTWYGSGVSLSNDLALSLGFMTAASSLTDQQLNSNLAVAAETLMMIKEHIIEQYGPIRYTLGIGCSGGSIEQNVITSQYPGLIDGLQIACTYPDAVSTGIEVSDCVLLVNYFSSPEFAALTAGLTPAEVNAKKAAIAGHKDQIGCLAWVGSFGSVGRPGFIPNLPSVGSNIFATTPRAEFPNNCLLPQSFVYDPIMNPAGLRCGIVDHGIAIWGNAGDPQFPTRANDVNDNVGVQYGLKALLNGAIGAEEFVTLNEKIGGTDPDGNFRAARTVADKFGLRTAYRSGFIGDGHSWANVPIIDLRGNDNSGIHHTWRSFALRARLDAANGTHANHVMWRFGPGLIPVGAGFKINFEAFATMNQWLANIEADTSHKPLPKKVIDDKPADAFDYCYLTSDTTFSTKVTDFSVCDADPVLAIFASPRQVAGGPLAENVMKCRLKPLNINDYPPGTFSGAQWARLEATFPDGVCDWNKRGVEQQPAVTYLTYEDGPGGKSLPREPRSH